MRRQTQEAMNRALDQQLDGEERDALYAHLDRSPTDARLWVNMQRVDRTLRGTINGGGPEYQFTSLNGQIFIRKKK